MTDYNRHVEQLMESHPLDDAMSLSVGGRFDKVGRVECMIARHAGLSDGDALLDFGCGSGRLAVALAAEMTLEHYMGIDVVETLLGYAAARTPEGYTFRHHTSLDVPAEDASFDHVVAFSVFTHLHLPEMFLYMTDMHRVLRPHGRLTFSFLELSHAPHWHTFVRTTEATRDATLPHVNSFIERSQIEVFAEKIGYQIIEFIDADRRWDGTALGQSVAILETRRG